MSNEDEISKALRRAYDAIDPSLDQSKSTVLRRLEALTSRPYPPASQPGSPPHRRSGKLSGGFKGRVRDKVLSIWNTAPYFDYVEQGTSKMRARPSLGVATRTFLAGTVRSNLARDIVNAERRGRGR